MSDIALLESPYFKIVPGCEALMLNATDGTQTITGATDVFHRRINSDFADLKLEAKIQPTNEVRVVGHELTRDGTFEQVFHGFGVDLNTLVFTPHQVREFCRIHRDKLSADWAGNFFLMKREKDEVAGITEGFFVAHAYFVDDGHLQVGVIELAYGSVWFARYLHRFWVPQSLSY